MVCNYDKSFAILNAAGHGVHVEETACNHGCNLNTIEVCKSDC